MQKINTTKYEEVIKRVFIDDRENERIDFAFNQFHSLNPLKAHLDIGDYIFQGYNGIKVCFEYKTGADFLNSINSETNHLHNQVWEMTNNYEYTFVIVECMDLSREADQLYYSSGISISLPQINGAIAEYNTVSTVLFTQTKYQAFDLMVRQAGKIIMQKPMCYKYGKKSTNWALNILGGMRGVEKKAENIVRTLNLHTLEDIMNLDKEQLMSVDLIGEKTAEKILENIKRWNTYDLTEDKEQSKLFNE